LPYGLGRTLRLHNEAILFRVRNVSMGKTSAVSCLRCMVCVAVDESDVERHLRRYTMYDTSQDAKSGIPLSTALLIPEFASNPLYPRILQIFVDAGTKRLTAERFLQMCALMSSSMPTAAKKQCMSVADAEHCILITFADISLSVQCSA